ncbi:SDR family NAD(P)-dependent oxidoreductase [Pleurocapsales cyanobacterium LEGE 06147]|nr:SDR family NAD(P)-dependent oxidoreductase [Pleurocapsales cyanobacterium LEGE 06147]
MTHELDGKVALVTGGTTGIGRETAIAFARAGAKVIVSGRGIERGRETVSSIQKEGGEATFIQTDISQATEVEAMIAKAVETHERLDCVFNNAGTEGKLAPITELTEEDLNLVKAKVQLQLTPFRRGCLLNLIQECGMHSFAVRVEAGGFLRL